MVLPVMNVDGYLERIDYDRALRVREIYDVKAFVLRKDARSDSVIAAKCVVLISYSNWEGFYNDCTRTYLEFLRKAGSRVSEVSWLLLCGVLEGGLQSMRDKGFSYKSKVEFVNSLRGLGSIKFDSFQDSIMYAKSNLNFDRLRQCGTLLDIDLSVFNKNRIRIDRELVGWRHAVAHGDAPDLNSMGISDHVDFVSKLMLDVSDIFQYAIVNEHGRLHG